VGSYLQRRGKAGEIQRWYQSSILSSARFTLNGPFFSGEWWKQFLYLGSHCLRTLGLEQITEIGSRDDDIVRARGDAVPKRPELLADHALDPVPPHRISHLLANRDPEAGWALCVLSAGKYVNHQIAIPFRVTRLVDTIEIGTAGKPASARLIPAFSQGQAERRRRPFLRRRFRIALPPRDELRARKPWVFDRLRFLGW